MASKDSPYSTGFLSSNINFSDDTSEMFKKIKEEEDITHEATPTLPFELSMLPEYFASMVDNGMNASINIDKVLSTKDLKNKNDLLKLKENLDKMIRFLVKNVDPTLDKFAIRSRVDSDEK